MVTATLRVAVVLPCGQKEHAPIGHLLFSRYGRCDSRSSLLVPTCPTLDTTDTALPTSGTLQVPTAKQKGGRGVNCNMNILKTNRHPCTVQHSRIRVVMLLSPARNKHHDRQVVLPDYRSAPSSAMRNRALERMESLGLAWDRRHTHLLSSSSYSSQPKTPCFV